MPAQSRHRAKLAAVSGPRTRRRLTLTSLIAAVVAALTLLPGVAVATPDHSSTEDLRKKLTAATQGYNNAKGRLRASRKKQKKLDKEIKSLKTRSDKLYGKIGQMAATVYKGSYADTVTALMESGSPEELANGMTTVSYLATRDHRQIKAFADVRDKLAKKRYVAELEIRKQRKHMKKMAKRKKEALGALIAAGGGDSTGGPDGGAATADPSPRAPDGSWPPQGCTEDDPTTGGCLTPRTKHALQEAREAGYTRYTKCWRESSGDHGAGRACDFAAFADGFRNQDAYGADKRYGDNLAGWFVANADALAVKYVIWYRRIWMPGSGWSSYNGGGSPSGDHTNHVHLSVQ